ncbi:hypothetical protein BG011_007108 [Mortierella polycephala]|uniref:CRIB domain-containing protein n=1 Tax=Mortierella polycephala TaxID=41804 RepID=A0A9P6PTJ6_9FUNG|nr:hypothetical protein BG011_007108 [Mortierella polycephala]
MGSFFSRPSKSTKPKDPKWQGIGPNTPLPSSSSTSNSNNLPGASGYNRYGSSQPQLHGQPRSQTLSTTKSTTTTKKPSNKSSKIMLLLKLDPKGRGGQRKIITKNLISLPSDFRHTGHIGAGEVRSGQIDPEKIKNQMMEVAACLKLDANEPIPMLKTVPIQPENRDEANTGVGA